LYLDTIHPGVNVHLPCSHVYLSFFVDHLTTLFTLM